MTGDNSTQHGFHRPYRADLSPKKAERAEKSTQDPVGGAKRGPSFPLGSTSRSKHLLLQPFQRVGNERDRPERRLIAAGDEDELVAILAHVVGRKREFP